MTDKFIYYEYDGKNLKVPVEQQKEFESRVPSAKMMLTYKDKNYKVPLSELETFTQKVGADKLTYSAFDDNKEYAPSLSTSKYVSFEEPKFEEESQYEDEPKKSYASASMADLTVADEENSNRIADILRDPNLSRRERKKAISAAKAVGEMPNTFETTGKAVGAIASSLGKIVVDVSNLGLKMSRLQNPAVGFADMVELKTGVPVPEELHRPEQVFLDKASAKLQDVTEELSMGADPTGGEMGFGELLKKGHIGLAMQKGWGSTLESVPMMVATKTPIGALIYGVGMAASNYADETRDNPDIPAWKRAINSVGSAAFELAVEKLIDIPWKYFKNAGGEITEDIVQEVLERAAEEGTQTIAKRIKRIIGNTAKDAIGEGFEEVVTSLGNDALGSALDAIDGNKDYGFKAQWEEFKEQNPDATVDDFTNAKGREYVESFLGGALSSVYMSGLANVVKEHQDASKVRGFNKAYVEGASLDYEDMYDTNDDVNDAIDNAVSASVNAKGETTLTREFVENLSAEEALALSRSEDVNKRQQAAFWKLAKQKAMQNGLTGKLDDRVASSISRITNVVEQASENGTITCGAYGDKIVFVKGGVVNADGTVSLPNGQNGPVIVIDRGEKYTVDSSEITEAWSTGADGYLQSAESSIRDRDAFMREEYINTVGPRAKAKAVKQYLNTKILINTEEGGMTQVEVQAILPNGEVLVKGKKGDLGGQSERLFGPSAFYDAIARNEDGSPVFVESLSKQQSTQTPTENTQTQAQPQQPATQSEPQDFRDSEQTILINGIPTTVEVTNQDDAADRVTYTYTDENGQEKTGTATVSGFADAIKQAEAETTVEIPEGQLSQQNPTDATPDTSDNGDSEIYVKPRKDEEEEASPTATTDTEQIQVEPQNINWDALFENDADAYFAEMQNQFGDKTAKRLGAVVAATQKKLDALNKATPETDNEIFENEEKKEKLEAKIEALNGMIARLSTEPIAETNAAPAAEQVASQEPTPAEPINEPNPTIPEPELVEPAQIEKDPEPRNAVEFAALMLGLKNGIKLTWESFKHHTGYGNGERSKFFGLFRTKEKGGMTMEAAGERLMEMDREYDTRFFDQSDPNAGLNAILEALQLNSTMGELRSYTRRQYEADAQREADEYNAYILNAYNEALLEEDVAREDVTQNALTEEQYNELITKFAEDINDYETESSQGDAASVSETEDIGDLPLATGETVRGGEGSNNVLQEAQPIQTRGEGAVYEESEGVNEGINREDADSPVYGGEPSVSEGESQEGGFVSSLDEDMPDFTTEAPRTPVAPKPVDNPIAEAQKREESLIPQLSREDIPFKQRQDLAYNAGKAVADFFATREEYEAYEEVAADLGEFIEDFDRGVEESFANRDNQYQISDDNLSVTSEAQQLVVDALMETLDGYVDTVIATDEQTQDMLDVRDELSGVELMTVYHGSPHKFDAFDHSHMGEGEGAQAHGWGTYVAKSRETSVAYARMGRVTYVGPKVNYGSYEYEVVEDITAIMRNGNTFDEAIQIGRRYWNNLKWEPSHRAKRAFLDTLRPEDFQLRSLYTVEIPEDNGSNYFDERTLSKEQTDRFVEACEKEGIDWVEVISEASEPVNILNNPNQGKRLYNSLIKTLGSDKAVSEFLSRAGFVGIKYDGRRDGECFVIFNENDAKITGRTEFYQTPNGTVYGWTDGKKIYLTKAGINPNTPIHEYTHLWAKAMMQKNPNGWNRIKQLLKGTPVWNEVMNDANYSNIHGDEDAVASEVLSRISGSQNAAKMERMAQKMIDEAKGTARKLEVRGLIQNMKDALNMFWEFVWTDLFKMTYFRNVEHVTDRVLFDLLNQTDLGELSEGQVETQIVTDPEVIAELEASPKVAGFRNVVQNEDGTFSSPMAYWLQSTKEGAKSRVETAKFELGKWEEAEEHPELVDENGKVTLVKPNKSTVDGVAYDPYIHNRLEPVNLQFKDAWKRDDLVYVETEVAENDLNDGYHADKALLPVGIHSWSNGDVMLSRYDKPVRVMPWDEVADAWAKRLNGEGVHFDVVPPAMRSLLVERGVEILPPHKGMGKKCNDAYAEWKKENEILSRKGENNTKFVEQFEFKQNNEQRELEYSDEFRRLQEESARMSGQLVSEKDGVQQTAIRELVGRIGGTLQRELDRARSGRGYKLRTLVNDSKGTSFDIIENVDGRLFHDIFEIVRTYLPNGELVDLHDNYNDAICYITSDGLAGFAVDAKGNLISVFSLYGNSKKGFLGAIKDLITEAGATHLDGYNSPKQPLAKIYSKVFGWKVASMMDYNMEYDHDNIAENHEMPQVAFMVNTDADIETKHFDKDQYDEAVAYQQEQVEVSNRVDTQNAAVDRHSGKTRSELIQRAVNEEAAKLGVQVTYKTREEMPAGHKNDKGYYNPQTGEIVVCTENATSIADAIKTILHEAVAHKGLRKLFGNRFDEFIRNVYDLLDAETKAKVDARAAAHYNGDTAVAMEEYMASLAENKNFADQTIWEKIKSIFTNLINDILGRNDIKIGDNELRYILRASYNNMVNPRSMDTIEGWAKDQLMREEYKVNESTPEILSRTGIDDIAFTTARDAYETVTFNGFTEIMKAIQSATGFKGKVKAIKTGLLKIWNEVQMENQDAQQAVIAGIEAIQKETGNIPIEDFENYLMAENQSQSRSAEEIESFLNNYFAPIVDHINTIITAVMKARGLNPKNKKKRAEIYAEVRNYMIAKHGLERNAYYQTTTGDMRDYSGLTSLFGLPDTEFALAETLAQDMVDKFENEIGDAARDALWDKINAATNKTLRHSYECGLLSRSQYDKIKDMFDFYIPLRGFDETTAEDVYSYARFDGNRFQPAVREAHGRTSLAFDPISVIMNMAQSEIVQGNKNRVKQMLYNFVGNRPNSLLTRRDCWYVLDMATGAWVEAYPDIANGETWDNFETRMQALEATGNAQKMKKGLDIGYRFQKPANKDEHYIHLKINGVEHAIYVNGNQRLAEGVNGFNRNTPNILDGIKKANRAASQLFTNYSYKFGGKNFLRDFIWAQTVMLIKESPLYMLRFAGNWMANNPITIGVLMKKYRDGTLDMSNNNHRLFKEFIENGGKTGYVFIDELEKQKSRIDKAIERMAKNGNTKTNNATKAALLLNIIQYVNECIELAARFGTYVTSRNAKDKSGNVRSITQSIDDAKGITTNFNRKGAQSGRGLIGGLANFMGSWNFFYNAAVQGVQQIKKLNNEHPIRAKAVIGGWIGLGFALPFILDIFRGDDDDDEIYWNIPEYERKNNICIPLGKGKVTLTIPLSPTIREAYAIGVTINDAIFNKSVDKDATMLSMECASLLAKALIPANPVEGLSAGLTPAENLIMFGTPDIADPIVEAVINKDWTGAPIEYKTSYNEGAPHYTKVVGKNNWKEEVGEKLYKLGEDNLGSSLDINLSAWEHVITSSTGGIGAMMKDISNIAEWVMSTETPERLNDIPVARTLFSSSAMDDEKFVNNIYWDMNDVYKKKTKNLSSVYGLTEKEAFAEQEGKGESNLVKVYEAKSYPFLKRYYELNKELSTMQKNIDKMPTETQSDKNEKVLAEQELFNKKRDMVYELLEYEIE